MIIINNNRYNNNNYYNNNKLNNIFFDEETPWVFQGIPCRNRQSLKSDSEVSGGNQS